MKLASILLAILFFSGCRTTQEVFTRQSKINEELTEHLDIQRKTSAAVLDSILSHYNATVSKLERQYALPDSSGYQAVISETEYHIDLIGETTTIRNRDTFQQEVLSNDVKLTTAGQKNESKGKKTDNRLFRPPQWFFVSFLILLVIGIIYYTYRKSICS